MTEHASVKVLISTGLIEQWAARDFEGRRLTWVWGEPDADGFYTPTVTRHDDDRLGELDAAWAEAEAALPKTGWPYEDGRWVIPSGHWSIGIEWVSSGDGYFEPYEEGYRATARLDPGKVVFGDLDSSPAAALRTLAANLREQVPA